MMSEKTWRCQVEDWGWGAICLACHTRHRYSQALSLCGCHSSAKQALQRKFMLWWLIFGCGEDHSLMNIIYTKAYCMHWTAVPEVLNPCVILVQLLCKTIQLRTILVSAQEPIQLVWALCFMDTLSLYLVPMQKVHLDGKSSWYKLKSRALCVHMAGSAHLCHQKLCK